MYESLFELDQRPFPATPLVGRYFAAGTIETARKSLARCIDRAEGTGLVVGPAGTGKTLLCYVLAEQFKASFSVVLLFSGNLTTRRELLQAILFELELPYRGMEEGELRLALIDHLSRGEKCPSGMLLIVDEAHSLPLKLLEEVRMITNLVRQGQPRVRLVLAGNPVLEEHLASPKLAALSQRLAARCYLESFDRAETLDYVRAQLAAVGGDANRIFRPDALEAIFRATDGIPRLVNQLCDQTLLLALTQGRREIDASVVEAAWANLQQLPTPWSAGSLSAAEGTSPATEVIEFGQLDESPLEADAFNNPLNAALAPPALATIEEPATLPVEPAPLLHLAQFDDPLEAIDDELSLVEIGLPEVDLLFDETEIENYPVLPEPSLAPLPLIATTQTPDNQVSSEHAFSVLDEPDFEDFVPQTAEPGLGEDEVFPEDAVEEVVVDRYAALDAQKGKGAWPTQGNRAPALKGQPSAQQPARVAPQAKPLHAAEKTLTLAEALVRQATAVEQAVMPSASSDALFTVMATQEHTADDISPAWLSLDLLPPGVDDVAAAPAPPLPEVVPQPEPFVPSACVMAESEPPQLMPFLVDLPSVPPVPAPYIEPFADFSPEATTPDVAPMVPAVPAEPELIIVEDDPVETAPPPPPQVEPVSKKAYRQLFARLRKG